MPSLSSPLNNSQQCLLVVSPDWRSSEACLQAYQRAGSQSPWQAFGKPLPVMLGRNGLAWGHGLHPEIADGTQKAEGDGCAPAGIFALTALFGRDGVGSPRARNARLPYLAVHTDLKAIDDPASRFYNRIVDQRCVAAPDWSSAEDMLRADSRYDLGAVVAHNVAPPLAGAGSCIFLHVWAGPGQPSAGCTTMSAAAMAMLADWLDMDACPLLVQLPRDQYLARSDAWQLPPLR